MSIWRINFDRAPVNVVPPPIPSFDLYGNLINDSADPAIPLLMEYSVYFMNRRIQPPGHTIFDGNPLAPERGTRFRLTLQFSRSLLELIETNRAGADRVSLRVDASVLGVRGSSFDREHVDHLQKEPYEVDRDRWLAILATFEHGQSEVFELPLRAIQLVPGYEDALLGLKDAEKALAQKNWRLVLIKLWNVFENVNLTAGGENQTGFERMLGEAFPREHHREVKDSMASLIAYLRLYQQRFMQAHGDEEVPVTREDALFAFETTLSILGYLSRRITSD